MKAKGKSSESKKVAKPPRKRPGVVSKNNTSNHKESKNYKKKYRSQGR